ncbi:MFS transporter [Pseudonocardia endophytica]|uniref:Putative proline/betaine transporter n=1 Tax=Pseudonocardia endophytica TaxID=401976 RepID=A0A4R1HJZ3_PSEEN|nr:MFS transporter [Pseudonocardia endophytica]TCK22178.1 MHS family proline/betaine transporter-like MFS transporter [Pseudonocardia endophytica]
MSQPSPPDAVSQVPAAPTSTGFSRRSVVAAGTGNALEFYDFAIFASLTPVISQLFFPSGDPLAAILSTLALFAVGFVMRPVGAVVFGRLADRHGRRIPLAVSILIMGVTTVLIGVMPTYDRAGILAPLLLCVARLLQGLSIGGEFGTSASFLVEHAPRHRRGLYGSFAFFSSTAGSVLGALVVLVLTVGMPPAVLNDWGWRVPFLLGFPLLAVGLYLRYRIAESPEFEAVRAGNARATSPVSTLFREHRRAFLTLLGVCIGFSVASSTVQAFVLTYIRTVVGLPAVPALTTVVLATSVGVALVLLFGQLSDRYGRRAVLVFAAVLTVLLPYPSLLVMGLGGFGPALVGQLILWVPVAAFGGAIPSLFAELFPARVRASGFGIGYGFGSAIFAGTAPFVATLLIELTGDTVSPAWYMTAAGAVTLAVVLASASVRRSSVS